MFIFFELTRITKKKKTHVLLRLRISLRMKTIFLSGIIAIEQRNVQVRWGQ